MSQQQNDIQIKASDQELKGTYANAVQITHTKEEFVLDCMNLFPWHKMGVLVSRIIFSPAHAKRLAEALQVNIKRYEEQHGTIEASSEKFDQSVGFKTE